MRAVPAFMSRFSIRVPTPGPEQEEPETTVDACGRSRLLSRKKVVQKKNLFSKIFPFLLLFHDQHPPMIRRVTLAMAEVQSPFHKPLLLLANEE